jgi:hypothetical protein
MKQLLWLCLLILPGLLVAQTAGNDIRPAALVDQAADLLEAQLPLTLFSRQLVTPKSQLQLSQYQLLELGDEAHQQLQHQPGPVLRLQLPLPDQQTIEVNLVAVDLPMPTVSTSSGEPVGQMSTPRHYRGLVAGDPQSLVALSVLDQGVQAVLSSPQLGGNWVLAPRPDVTKSLGSSTTDYVFYQDKEVLQAEAFSCATADSGIAYAVEELREASSQGRSLNDCVQVYFEVNYDIYQHQGSVAAAAQYVTALFNQVATLYANEQINLSISEVMVWDTPSPYTSTSSVEMLTHFQSTRTSFNGDLAQLLSYRASGGIAVVDGLCHPYTMAKMSYSGIGSTFREVPAYSWSVMVVAHELGHLLGSQHTHACVWNGNSTALDGCPGYTEGSCADPGLPTDGGTIMSYCHLSLAGIDLSKGFGPQPGALIRNRVDAASCLTGCSTGGGTGGSGNPPTPPTPACAGEEILLQLQLDTYSPETSWVLRDAQQAIVAQGGPYHKARANQVVLDTFCLSEGCYQFEIRDSYNDGICCDYGQGSYRLTGADQRILAVGGEFPSLEQSNFCVPGEDANPAVDCVPVDFQMMPVISYGGAQDIGEYSIQDNGQTLYLSNNAWKAVMLDYEITRNTVLAFDFKSTRQGEIHGIGFDDNNYISYNYTARVYGTQGWGISDYADYPGDQNWKSYAIPIGQHYIGSADRLFFVADHDSGRRDGNSWFRHVRIYERSDCYTETTAMAASGVAEGLRLSVYPNPAPASQVSLRVATPTTGRGQWALLTLTGQPLRTGTVVLSTAATVVPLDLQGVARGTYLLRWRDEGGEQTIRLTRQ